MMGVNPPTLVGSMSSHEVYVKPSALANYQGNEVWNKNTLKTQIPLNVKAGWSTRCFDFDVQCPTDGSVKPYVVTSFDPADRSTRLTPLAGGYIPSRQGEGNNEFVGVLLQVASGVTTVNVTMGENDYKSGNQTTYDGPNYLVGATVPTFVTVKETREGTSYTNFGLSQGEFRLFSGNGITTRSEWSRAYLSLPLGTSPAKAFTFFFDTQTTGIRSVENEAADDAWYTLGGVKVDKPGKGVFIHRGRRVLVR